MRVPRSEAPAALATAVAVVLPVARWEKTRNCKAVVKTLEGAKEK